MKEWLQKKKEARERMWRIKETRMSDMEMVRKDAVYD
jgi:hypothetical protein